MIKIYLPALDAKTLQKLVGFIDESFLIRCKRRTRVVGVEERPSSGENIFEVVPEPEPAILFPSIYAVILIVEGI
jgi:hypothetical protein